MTPAIDGPKTKSRRASSQLMENVLAHAHAVRIHRNGGPEQLSYELIEVGDPGPGEARIRHTARKAL